MTNKVYYLALAAIAMSVGSCSNDDGPKNPQYITVSTNIESMTRVTTDVESFEEGDCISVYGWTGAADVVPAAGERVVDNSINTLSNGVWVAVPQMLWKDMLSEHYFIGVYPAIEQGNGLDNDLSDYSYKLNVADQTASDLMVAVNTVGYKATSASVPLDFSHVMSKVCINLTFRNQWGEEGPEVTSVSLKNAVQGAKVNLLTKAVTPDENGHVDIAIPEIKANTSFSSIFIPQEGVREIVVLIDGKEYKYKHTDESGNSADILFEPGKYTTINLIVGQDEIALAGVSITPWAEGTLINGGEALTE